MNFKQILLYSFNPAFKFNNKFQLFSHVIKMSSNHDLYDDNQCCHVHLLIWAFVSVIIFFDSTSESPIFSLDLNNSVRASF